MLVIASWLCRMLPQSMISVAMLYTVGLQMPVMVPTPFRTLVSNFSICAAKTSTRTLVSSKVQSDVNYGMYSKPVCRLNRIYNHQ